MSLILDDFGASRRNKAPCDAVTALIIQGLTANGAKIPETFVPFVDKSKVGSLPMKPSHHPVVGYKMRTGGAKAVKMKKMVPKRKGAPKREQAIKPAPPSGSESEGVVIGSSTESDSGSSIDLGSCTESSSGNFVSSDGHVVPAEGKK